MRLRGKREEECRSAAGFALEPDPPTMDFDDPFYQGESHTRALGFDIQFIEEAKDAFVVLRSNAHAVVPDIEDRFPLFLAAMTDLDARIGLIAHVFGSIIDQVL